MAFVNNTNEDVVSFSPLNNSISILKIDLKINKNNLAKYLQIPIDGIVESNQNITDKNITSILLKSSFPFDSSLENMNRIDSFRLFLFAKGVSANSLYQRELNLTTTDIQKSTLISLTFTDPAIYRENQTIQIINATNVYGLGARLANFITNLGGSVILISTGENSSSSKIVYYGKESYTVSKLSDVLGISPTQTNSKGLADVIIMIGKDRGDNPNF